ncbi:MAG: pre-peptidase C-terminal domain-containing protein [Candidatus Melainabacteria bacterium]|nr:pre-peptidase C-terminal domain-containing protein [Candidatus Melainabacteria bacterium]
MKKITLLFLLLMLLLGYTSTIAEAGGPLVVKGGMAITYGTRPLNYRYDKGPCGMFSNSEVIAIIESLFSDWESVSTSTITFEQDSPGTLDFDVTDQNFDSILNSPSLLGFTPVIFDTDGKLFDAFLGQGAGNSVLGVAGPITVNSGTFVNQIAESQAIFNGKFVNGTDTFSDPESSTDAFKGTIIHEFGHGFGLDHAQINIEAIKPGATQADKESVPLLFPIAVNDLFGILTDDVSQASLLYPNFAELDKGFGQIDGFVFRSDGMTAIQGANVIARNVSDPKLTAISCVSDYLIENNGRYTLFAVPAGDYKVEIEPIDLSFTGGSGVGPFTESKSDKSFQSPVPKGFYTGPDKPITTDESQALIIMVAAGQKIEGQNIIASTSVTTSGGSSTTSSTSGGIVAESEPNDTVDGAQAVQLPVTISGSAAASDDGEIELSSDTGSSVVISDLFKFTLTSTASINALLMSDSSDDLNDLDLVLLDEFATDILDASSQSGTDDELISKSLQPGTYLLGVGAFSGATSYTLEITIIGEGGNPAITLSSPSAFIPKAKGKNKFMIKVNAFNFDSKSTCEVSTSDNVEVMIRPSIFMLGGKKTSAKVKFALPRPEALRVLEQGTNETLTISIICTNGASDETDISVTGDLSSSFRTNEACESQHRTYRYIRKK